jgi:hypothetical protein
VNAEAFEVDETPETDDDPEIRREMLAKPGS